MPRKRVFGHGRGCLLLPFAAIVAGCSAFSGYPTNYQNTDAVIEADKPYLSADVRANGNAASDAARAGVPAQKYRDAVTYARIEVIDIYYYSFESSLASAYNGLDVGADLAVLTLNGLGATAGAKATKAALAAASAGVVGAKATVNTDIFYQKTLPALVAEMRASRQAALAVIKTGLNQPVEKYSIDQALFDINAYYVAGTLPSAVAQVTAQAGAKLSEANDALAAIRTTSYAPPDSSAKRMIGWLYPGGDQTKKPIPARVTQLTHWMQNDKIDPLLNGMPYVLLLDANYKNGDPDRARAIAEIPIP